MAVPAIGGAYIAGGGIIAGLAWLATPEGQRAGQTFGQAVAGGTSRAAEQVSSLFRSEEKESDRPAAVPATNDAVRRCDGVHRGRLQVQGYRRPEPVDLDALVPMISWGWNQPCPPLRQEGKAQLATNLLVQTQNISWVGAGIRAGCFARMSRYIDSAPPIGFIAYHSIGWGINPAGRVVRNTEAGPRAPRVDLEVHVGRAFGDS